MSQPFPGSGVYLDHAATTPVSAAARAALLAGLERWANPSSPHAEGRAARAALEGARDRIRAALGWPGDVIFTSGASEAIALALSRAKGGRPLATSPVEHDAVLRVTPGAHRLPVDAAGRVLATQPGALHAIQMVNNETGVIQPVAALTDEIHGSGGLLLCDAAQGAGKLPLPEGADMIALSAHKFGGPPGVGALLVRDLAHLEPCGGQERGYRGGTENLPGVLAMAAALEEGAGWLENAAALRARLEAEMVAMGAQVVAGEAERSPAIGSYRMPGVSAQAQLIRFDAAGIALSAGSACSSGTLRSSPVLLAMGWDAKAAGEVVRVSFGRTTGAAEVDRFLAVWRGMAGAA